MTALSLVAIAVPAVLAAPAPATGAKLSLSSDAAGATNVTYTVELTMPSDVALAAATGVTDKAPTSLVQLEAPAGTFPTKPPCSVSITLADLSTGRSSTTPLCAQTTNADGSELTIESPVAVGAGEQLEVAVPGLDNPAKAGVRELSVRASLSPAATVRFEVVPTGAVSALSLSRSDMAAGASEVTYTIVFKASPTGGLAAGTGTITFTLPRGTFPAKPSCFVSVTVTDITTKATSTAALCNQAVLEGGSQLVVTSPVDVGGGDEVEVVAPGLDNPAAGPHELSVGTSADATRTVGFGTSAPSSVSHVQVSVSTLAGPAAKVIYAVTFTTSGSGALGANIGVVSLRAPPGTFPVSPGCGQVVATISDVATGAEGQDDLCHEQVDKDGSSAQLVTPVAIGAGQVVRVVVSGLHRSGALARATVSVSTSADAEPVSYRLGGPGTPVTNVSVSLSSRAAGATRVTYTLELTTSADGAVPAGSGDIVVSAPAGTFPARPVCSQALATFTDLTTKASGQDELCTATVAADGSQLQLASPVAIRGGQRVRLALSGLANPPSPGRHTIFVATSANSSAPAAYAIVAATSVSSPTLVVSNPAAGLAGVTYGASFTASGNGELAVGSGLVYVVLPPGTWPSSKLCADDGATVTDLSTKATGQVFNCSSTSGGGRVSLSLQVPVPVATGDKVAVAIPGLTNPVGMGEHSAWLSTSSDSQLHRVRFTTLPSGRLSGTVRDSSGYAVAGAEVQACSPLGGQCFDTTAGPHGAFDERVPFGHYTLSSFPPAETAEGGDLAPSTDPAQIKVSNPAGVVDETLVERVLKGLPGHVALAGQDGGVPTIYAFGSSPMTVHGCKDGVGAVMVSGTNTRTGQPAKKIFLMFESPPGSGRYSVTIPPLWPIHGDATISYKIYCFEAVLPKAGPAAGGNVVLVHGSGFSGVTGVKFGNVPAVHFHILSSSVIEAVAPPGSGTVEVSVMTHHGTAGGGANTAYTYISLQSLSPSYGSSSSSTRVTITGHNLGDVDTVWFGDRLAVGTEVISDHELVAFAPPGSGTVPVRMGQIGPTKSGLELSGPPYALLFHYRSVASPTPATQARPVALWSPDIGRLPPARTQAAELRAAGGSAGPTVTDWGGLLTAEGTGVGALVGIFVGLGTALPSGIFALSTTTIVGTTAVTAATPVGIILGGLAAAAGVALLIGFLLSQSASNNSSSNGAKPGGAGQSGSFSALIDPSGTVEDTNGNPIAGATAVLEQAPTRDGPFRRAAAVSPGVLPHRNPEKTKADGQFHWEVISDYYKIVATARGCHAPGNPAEPSVSTPVLPVPPPQLGLALVFQCAHEVVPERPAVASVSTAELPSTGAAQVDLVGRDFTPSSVVHFGTARSLSVKYASPQLLVATAPPGRGTVGVSVTTAGGTSPASPADVVKYTPAPVVEKVSPAMGPTTGGTRVVVYGAGFTGAVLVTVGTAVVTHFSIKSGNEISLTMPPGHTGAVGIRVLTLLGLSSATRADRFTYERPAPPPTTAVPTTGARS